MCIRDSLKSVTTKDLNDWKDYVLNRKIKKEEAKTKNGSWQKTFYYIDNYRDALYT